MSKYQSQSKTETSSYIADFAATLVGTFSLVALLAACEKSPPLVPLETVNMASTVTNSVQVNFCTPPAVQQKQYLKTVIVLDHSGSNGTNYKMTTDGTGAPDVSSGNLVISPIYATDPKGLTRYGTPTTSGTLLNYLSTLPANDSTDPTRFFAMVNFNSGATTFPASSSGFTSDIAGFYNQVYSDAGTASGGAPNDSGGTSYLTAMTAAYNIVNNDIQAAKTCAAKATTAAPTTACPKPGVATSSSYVVVFMSDGSPIINISGVGTDSSGNTVLTGGPIVLTKESSTDILAKVSALMALQSNDKYVTSINIFTIYYYTPGNVDSSSQTLLTQMAKAGNGLTYNALSGSNIDYKQFQPPTKLLQYNLSDIFVTNTSGVWWTDGKYHLDSDHDGLPDDVETAWGSDPNNAFSDNNGVSDYVKYTVTNAAACTNKNTSGRCTDAVVNYKTGVCSSITTSTVAGKLTYKSSDPDGLNDCEKILLSNSAGIGVPDSNADSIPDWLEFVNNIPFQSGTSPAVTAVLQDGKTTYQKIKYSLPVNFPLNTMPNVTPSIYNVNQTTSPTNQICYQYNVTNLPISSATSTDRIRVDVIMKSNLVKDGYLYKVGYKSFPSASTRTLQFNDWNDTTEIANKTWSSWP